LWVLARSKTDICLYIYTACRRVKVLHSSVSYDSDDRSCGIFGGIQPRQFQRELKLFKGHMTRED
jgi:hypothetical protein